MKVTNHPFRLGVTGGVGCGKSTAGEILKKLGWQVIDADNIARKILSQDREVIGAISARWAHSVNPDGSINRRLLAEIVFKDESERELLNTLTHPKIRSTWRKERQDFEEKGSRTAVILPLLHEVGAESEFDATLCVGCSQETQISRLLSRGWSPEHSLKRIRAQLPLAEKIALSTFLVWNDDRLQHLEAQLKFMKNLHQQIGINPAAGIQITEINSKI